MKLINLNSVTVRVQINIMWLSSGMNGNIRIAPAVHRPRANMKNTGRWSVLDTRERKRRDVTTPSRCVVGGASVTGKVFLQRSEEVADHRHAPRPSQKPLPGEATHVGHICVMDGEAENSETHTQNRGFYTQVHTGESHELKRKKKEAYFQDYDHFVYGY